MNIQKCTCGKCINSKNGSSIGITKENIDNKSVVINWYTCKSCKSTTMILIKGKPD